MKTEIVLIHSEFIKLDQFLKMACLTSSGSEAKNLIAAGKILVNEEIETRRGRKLIPGDRVATLECSFVVKREDLDASCS
jgi:ribosome-associated protein YbcJ (S4-like RNA binding protein)